MDKIRTVKIKNEDGSISQETYTISVAAKDVDMTNGKDLQDTIGNIDIDRDGNIENQLKSKIDRTDIVDSLDSTLNTKVLSAAQGKELKDEIETLDGKISSNIKYHFIKTGNNSGDCSLLELDGKNYLIDVSGQATSTALETYFSNNHINKLDGIIISHYHGDHTGGASAQGFVALLNSNYITSDTIVYLPTDPDYTRFTDDSTNVVSRIQTIRTNIINACNTHRLSVIHPVTGDTIVNKHTTLRFLNNDTNSYENYYSYLRDSNNNLTTHTNYNNFSLVVEVQNLNNTALFTGDIELPAQGQVEKYLHRKINLKKIEHHGVNHLADKNYLKKSSAYINVCMNTIAFAGNYNPGRYESFAYMIKNGDKIYSVENNNSMIFIDNGYTIYQNSNLVNEEFLLPNGVAGFIASGTNNFKNLGEVSYRNFINEGDDLNDYMTPGDYIANTAAVAQTLINTPVTLNGFKLTVEYNLNRERIVQKVFRNHKNIEIYYRYHDDNGWNDWNLFTPYRHAQVTLTTSTVLSGSSDYIKIPFNKLTHRTFCELTDDGGIHALESFIGLTGGYVTVSGVNENDVLNLAVFKNDVRIARFGVRTSATEITLQVPQIMVSLTSSDTLYLYIRNQTSSTATIAVNNSFNLISC